MAGERAQILEVDTASGSYQVCVTGRRAFRPSGLCRATDRGSALEAAEPPVTFSSVRLAERSGPLAGRREIQTTVSMLVAIWIVEDCLTLNVFAAVDDSAGLPVMVWFHGGSNTADMGERKSLTGPIWQHGAQWL